MRILSEAYKDLAQRAGRYPKLRMELYAGARGEWTDTVEQEYSGENAIISATYTNGVITKPSRFETGLAFCGSLEIELNGVSTEEFTAGKRFKLYAGFYDPEEDKIIEATMGEFFVESISADNGKTTVKARDKMMFAEQKFNALLLTYPCSLLDCVREIFRQMGFVLPEDYTLDINPTVVAPAWQKPNMTEGVYYNGSYYVEDPKGYSIMMPGAENPTKGHVYSATGFALTCREALASAAKMQLGNVFIDAEGIPRFSSYKAASALGDDRVTGLSVGEEDFTINKINYNYLGYVAESVNLYKRSETERRGEIVYYTNFPSELPESYDPVKTRAVGQTFYEGEVERKGLGEAQIGDFIDYSGKLGTRRFFVFGLQYDWSGASFDETIYSFAPDYKGVDYEWLNDRDLVADEDKSEEPVEKEEPNVPDTGGGGINIDYAVIIKEEDAQYLLHNFTQIEYNRGSQIGYAGGQNQIVIQGLICYKEGGIAPNGATVVVKSNTINESDIPDVPTYAQMNFDPAVKVGTNEKFVKIELRPFSFSTTYYILKIFGVKEDGTEMQIGNSGGYTNYDNYSPGLAFVWKTITPPGESDFGSATVTLFLKHKASATAYRFVSAGTNFTINFASLAEYQAAIGLTYEPLTLTEVTDNPTVVSGKEVE